MSWGKLDDGFHAHPKLLRVGLEGTGLHARAISYCAHYETDGVLPKEWAYSQTRSEGLVQKMVEAGLWEELDATTFRVHDFLNYNPSKAESEARREKTNERVKRFRAGGNVTPLHND